MTEFLKSYGGSLVAIAIALGGVAYNNGSRDKDISQLNKDIAAVRGDIDSIRVNGTPNTQAHTIMLDIHTKDIGELKQDARRTNDTISDIKGDVKLIAEWVREQKQKTGR